MLITHGGAGTCLEALSPPGRRKVIIAMNQNLMGNHQAELAFTLAAGKHAIVTTPDDLINFFLTGVSGVDPSYPIQLQQRELCHLLGPQTLPQDAGFEPFHQGDPKKLINYLDMRMNIASLLFS
ncbi:unnamed protein product [Protopolystoma xenopodis]|uniref:UDP-N-acetylglucosamine transferase subunit ALG13 n=1 Tax=Protopolystoma xenopodis TaxID=117903 RepID=A0A3S5AFY4_9PLAT|nr:unnamed protein product [Protopolystoma xenopodis]